MLRRIAAVTGAVAVITGALTFGAGVASADPHGCWAAHCNQGTTVVTDATPHCLTMGCI